MGVSVVAARDAVATWASRMGAWRILRGREGPLGASKSREFRLRWAGIPAVLAIDAKPIAPIPTREDAHANVEDSLLRKLALRLGGDIESLGLDPDEEERLTEALDAEAEDAADATPGDAESAPEYENWFLRRRGAQSSYRSQRHRQFYAILVDEKLKRVVGVGPSLGKEDPWKVERKGSVVTVYPVDEEGHERVWRYSRETMLRHIQADEIRLGTFNQDRPAALWTLNHRKLKKGVRRQKTVWWDVRHDAGTHGTGVINRLLGKRGLFPFPKSLYAVRDCLAAVVRERPNALILDFFAGSGTTLHATCLLNAEDGGARRCILVTNNEVDDATAKRLNEDGIYRGDKEFERHGIFESVTRPRCKAAITGRRPDDAPIEGKHVGGRPFAQGFSENVEFFGLTYLDRDDIDLGARFAALLPALWLAAGGVGSRDAAVATNGTFSMPAGGSYGVLFRASGLRPFLLALRSRPDVTHVWAVTDSDEACAELRAKLPPGVTLGKLYGDYLRHFEKTLTETR